MVTQCNYEAGPWCSAQAWLTTWELVNDEPGYPRLDWRCGEIKRVAIDTIDGAIVSTVLVGHLLPAPMPYETLVRGGEWSEYGDQYETREAALRGHWAVCERLRRGEVPYLTEDMS